MGAVSGGLRFRVLGPIEATRSDDEVVRLSGERQRALLALLLVHAGEPVSVDRLVEELFGGERSDAAVGSARVAVSRLRRLLEDGTGGSVLATRAGGYVVATDPDRLDASRFERLVGEGRSALRGGDAMAAATRLREALSLWRGPPYADVARFDFVQAEIRRLEELRLAALTDRIEADLELGGGSELIGELEALISESPLQERLRGQLMLALYRSGRQADALAVYRQASQLLRGELGLEPSRELQELEGAILRQDPELASARDRSAWERAAICPFKGLSSFDRSDAEYFFGRERLISELIARLAEARLVGIVGPSGIGKSSLLRAGLLARVAAGALPGSERWRQVLIRPGEHPSTSLERIFDRGDAEATLASLHPGERLVVAVDQLEEIFTACADEHERSNFFAQLSAVTEDPERRCVVLVALRADFYGRCASYPRFARALSRNHVLVGPMERAELAEAIEAPATRAGLAVERPLLDALVSDVAGEPGGLPLLSTALLELWRGRDGVLLRYQSYRVSGGVRGAVARLAERAYGDLDERDQGVARRLLLRLAGGEDGTLARRRVALAEIGRIDGADRVLPPLTDARLLTVSEGEVELSHEALLREWPRYRGWLEEDRVGRRLHAHLRVSAREWEARGRDPGELYRGARLAATADWAEQHPGELEPAEREFVRVSRLATEREERRQRVQNRRLRALLGGVGVLLAVSVVAGIIALVKQSTASDEARAALAGKLGAEAVSQPRIDLAMLLAREAVSLDRTPDTESALLATLLRSPAAIGTFTVPIDSRPQAVTVSPDGHTLAVPDNNGNLRLYNVATHRLKEALSNVLTEPAFYSADDALLLYFTPQDLEVRDAKTLGRVAALRFDQAFAGEATADAAESSVAISPDRRTVYYAYWLVNAAGAPGAAYVDRWSLPSGRLLPRIRVGSGETAVRLTGGGRELDVLTDTYVRALDPRSLRQRRSVSFRLPGSFRGWAGAISPDGSTATIGTDAGAVYFLDARTGAVRQGPGGHSNGVATVVYSPDGHRVVTTGDDDEVRVWDPASGAPLDVLRGHGGDVHGAAFAADGRTLFTSSLDGTIFEWDLGGSRRFGQPFSVGPALTCCAPDTPGTPPLTISPSGSTFATRTGASTIGLFSTLDLTEQGQVPIGDRAGIATAVAWSPTGSQLAVAGHNGILQLWQLSGTPRLVRTFAGLRSLTGLPEALQAVSFSRDGSFIAATDINHTAGTGLPDGHLAIWRTSTGRLVARPLDLHVPGDSVAFSPSGKQITVGLDDGHVLILNGDGTRRQRTLLPLGGAHFAGVNSLAFAPNGTLATGNAAGVVQLWDPINGRALGHPVLVAAAPVASIAFDPTGERFVTAGGADGTVKLWSTPELQQIGTSLSSVTGSWGDAEFTPDGRQLITIQDDGQGVKWPVSLAAWERHACAVAGRNLTREEWSRFVSGYAYTRVCP